MERFFTYLFKHDFSFTSMLSIELAVPAAILGILFLYKCSDILIEGTAKTAMKFGVSSLVISLTLVAYGTSMPELAISVTAAAEGHPAISLGNVIGSNIANLLLILGIGALIRPLTIERGIIRRELLIMIGATALLFLVPLFEFTGVPSWIAGIIFLICFAAYIFYFLRSALKERKPSPTSQLGKTQKYILFIIGGILGVIFGAWLLVESSVSIARFLGIPELIIALTMVAVGTSLPELVVSSLAAYRKQSQIAIGNIIGSNIFNILLILGIALLFIPMNATMSLVYLFFLLAVSLLMVPLMYIGGKLSRLNGVFMLLLYSGYLGYLFFSV